MIGQVRPGTGIAGKGHGFIVADLQEVCKDCGKIHVTAAGGRACRGHLTGSNKKTPCKAPPIQGGFVCRVHGGALAKTKVAAAERLALMSAQGEIADLMRACDIPEQHPVDGLLEVVRVSGAMVRLLTIKVGELQEDPSTEDVLVESRDGDMSTKKLAAGDGFWGLNAQGEMVPHTYVQLLRVWSERYERACKTALDAGIEERRIRLAEDTSKTFFDALSKAVQAVALPPELRTALNQALAEELRKSTVAIEGT